MRTENDGREKTAAGNAPASGTELRGLRILLLEDNTVCAEITKALLEALGAAVDCAPDGTRASGSSSPPLPAAMPPS